MKIKINGVYYHVEITGQDKPLLLLHGFTESLENWRPFLHGWGSSCQVMMLDILGHGRSDCPKEPLRYAIEQISADIKEILQELKIKKTHILGYSMGGRLALTFAVKYPEYVTSLILESSSPGLETEQERMERIRKDEALADIILELGMEAFIDYWETLPLFLSQQSLPADVRGIIRNQRLNNNPLGLANTLRGMGSGRQPSLWNCLRQLYVPVYLMVGEKDEKFCRIAEKMSKKLPNPKATVIAGAGHAIHVEHPEIYGKMVLDFLKSI